MKYRYLRHVDALHAAVKTATRLSITLYDEAGKAIGVQPTHDYSPAHAWVLEKDSGDTVSFHHDQTAKLLKYLEPVADQEDLGVEVATLYKVATSVRRSNVRASRRVDTTAMARIERAVRVGRLTAVD